MKYSITELSFNELLTARKALNIPGAYGDPDPEQEAPPAPVDLEVGPTKPLDEPPRGSQDAVLTAALHAHNAYPSYLFGFEIRRDGTWWIKAIERPGRINQVIHGQADDHKFISEAWTEVASRLPRATAVLAGDPNYLFDRIHARSKVSTGSRPHEKFSLRLRPGKPNQYRFIVTYGEPKVEMPETNTMLAAVEAYEGAS